MIGEGPCSSGRKRLSLFREDTKNLKQMEKAYLEIKRRIEEQKEALFWASMGRGVARSHRSASSNTTRITTWQTGEYGLWARTSWKGDSYLFGFDRQKMIDRLDQMALAKRSINHWFRFYYYHQKKRRPEKC